MRQTGSTGRPPLDPAVRIESIAHTSAGSLTFLSCRRRGPARRSLSSSPSAAARVASVRSSSPASRGVGHPSGEIDAGPKPITVATNRGSRVETDRHAWEGVLPSEFLRQPKTQSHGVARPRDAQHQRIAHDLHLLSPVARQELAHGGTERPDEVRRPLVAVRFGQGGEAGKIGEEEGV